MGKPSLAALSSAARSSRAPEFLSVNFEGGQVRSGNSLSTRSSSVGGQPLIRWLPVVGALVALAAAGAYYERQRPGSIVRINLDPLPGASAPSLPRVRRFGKG